MRTDTLDGPTRGLVALGLFAAVTMLAPMAVAAPPESSAVDEARQALKAAEFDRLVELLKPTIEADDAVDSDDEARAHLLYALGLAHRARLEAPDGEAPELQQRADDHIDRALQADPDLEVDPMVYPPRFVRRVQQARQGRPDAEAETEIPEVMYVERRIEHRSRLPLYLPGGVGQFYNDATFRGVTFGLVQVLGLAMNVGGYWRIESLRDDAGHLDAGDVDRARSWRRAQYAGLAMVAGGWLVGAIEAHLNFDARRVRFRMLDEAPDELEPFDQPASSTTSIRRAPGLEWSLRF